MNKTLLDKDQRTRMVNMWDQKFLQRSFELLHIDMNRDMVEGPGSSLEAEGLPFGLVL